MISGMPAERPNDMYRSNVVKSTLLETETSGLEGYDYEFVPSLDNKHSCPICLLALRNPVQTDCGHRFCQPCITRSLEIRQQCPVDNAPLNIKQLFQDKYARREVLDLKARCPNKGCDTICELRLMETHMKVCKMRKIPCKNNCGLSLLPQDAVYHEEKQCPMRPVKCDVCGQTYPANSEEQHKEECKQHQAVSCPHCHHELKQYRLPYHVANECPQAPIKCVFSKVGCPQELPRFKIQHHIEQSTQIHLQYLLNHVSHVEKSNTDLSNLLETLNTKIQSMEKEETSYETSDDIDIYERDEQGLANGFGNIPRRAARKPPAPSNDNEEDEIDRIKKYNHMMENRAPAPNTSEDREDQLTGLDHKVRELTAKMDNQIMSMKDLSSRLSSIERRMEDQELRCCNGLFFWKIRGYSEHRKAASTGEVSVLHSPGFYSSPQGYRICIRVNLDGVESAQGTHLSLFVHLMKGENDDILSWPFAGTITLTVINQRDQPQDRSHISETLEARGNLTAFQRPVSERNQKGYGYIDFFPLNMLESEGFIKNDTLIIKAVVRVDGNGGANPTNPSVYH